MAGNTKSQVAESDGESKLLVPEPRQMPKSKRSIMVDAEATEALRAALMAQRLQDPTSATDRSCSSQGGLGNELDQQLAGDKSLCSRIYNFWWRMRLHIWLFVEEPFATPALSIWAYGMVALIIVSIILSIGHVQPTGLSASDPATFADFGCNLIFSIEVLLRLWTSPKWQRFFLSAPNCIDFCAVVPFFINDVGHLHEELWYGLEVLSIFESFLRLLKLCRYFWGWDLLFHALQTSAEALVIPLFFLLLIVFFGASMILSFEIFFEHLSFEATVAPHTPFSRLIDAVHYCIVVAVSIMVGSIYDMEPTTPPGRGVAVVLMVVGVLFLSMPIAIVGACFSEAWFHQDRIILLHKMRNRIAQHGYSSDQIREVFDDIDEDESGYIEFQEFVLLLDAFHFPSNQAQARALFDYFDIDADGDISFQDFSLTLYPKKMELLEEEKWQSMDSDDWSDDEDYEEAEFEQIHEGHFELKSRRKAFADPGLRQSADSQGSQDDGEGDESNEEESEKDEDSNGDREEDEKNWPEAEKEEMHDIDAEKDKKGPQADIRKTMLPPFKTIDDEETCAKNINKEKEDRGFEPADTDVKDENEHSAAKEAKPETDDDLQKEGPAENGEGEREELAIHNAGSDQDRENLGQEEVKEETECAEPEIELEETPDDWVANLNAEKKVVPPTSNGGTTFGHTMSLGRQPGLNNFAAQGSLGVPTAEGKKRSSTSSNSAESKHDMSVKRSFGSMQSNASTRSNRPAQPCGSPRILDEVQDMQSPADAFSLIDMMRSAKDSHHAEMTRMFSRIESMLVRLQTEVNDGKVVNKSGMVTEQPFPSFASHGARRRSSGKRTSLDDVQAHERRSSSDKTSSGRLTALRKSSDSVGGLSGAGPPEFPSSSKRALIKQGSSSRLSHSGSKSFEDQHNHDEPSEIHRTSVLPEERPTQRKSESHRPSNAMIKTKSIKQEMTKQQSLSAAKQIRNLTQSFESEDPHSGPRRKAQSQKRDTLSLPDDDEDQATVVGKSRTESRMSFGHNKLSKRSNLPAEAPMGMTRMKSEKKTQPPDGRRGIFSTFNR